MSPRRVIVLGSGGREHALAWRLASDAAAPEVLVAPGNPGLARPLACVPVDPLDPGAVVRLARDREADLVVVGPEAPLAAGVADALRAARIPVFGPDRAAARLESSKWFAKTVLHEARVPTARAMRCEELAGARAALDGFDPPWVLKADGLAAGKGVLVTRDRQAAEAFLADCLAGRAFGEGGRVVVLEEFLEGIEASVMAVCDGRRFVLLPPARDFKRAYDDDRGPNTGGMGAWAPHPDVEADFEREIGERVIAPVLDRMRSAGTPFRGLLYAGLMLTEDGPRVIEFNVRFGDPETQVVLPRLAGDFGALLAGAAAESLDAGLIRRERGASVAIAIADADYPGPVRGGGLIEGLDACDGREGVRVFHAATAPVAGGHRITGGRAAYVTGSAGTLAAAGARALEAVRTLGGGGWRCRADVATRAMSRPHQGPSTEHSGPAPAPVANGG